MELLFKLIKTFPRFFSLIGIKDLQPDKPDERDDVMGAESRFNWKILNEDADWREDFKRTDLEVQKWMDCTGHALKAIIQALYWRKWGIKISISAAYINRMAGTSKWRGNSMRTVLNSVRKSGWVTDEEWPEKNRWQWIPQNVINKGKNRLKEYNFGYDSVLPSKKAMDFATQFSPLYGGGFAWSRRGNLYYSLGRPNHSFILLFNLAKRFAGDSYEPYIKQLADNYKFVWPRRIYLEKKDLEYNKEEIQKLLHRGLFYIMRVFKNGEVYALHKDKLEYLAPQEVKNLAITNLNKDKKLVGVTEETFFNLIS